MQRADESAGDGGRRAEFERRRQERITATGDAAAITLAFAIVMSFTVAFGWVHGSEFLYTVAAGAIGLLSLRAQGLWKSHKIAVRWVELAGVAKASAFILGGVLIIDRLLGPALRLRWITAAAVLAFVFLVLWRSLLRSWLTVNRRQGRMVQLDASSSAPTSGRWSSSASPRSTPRPASRVVGIVGSGLEAEAAGRGRPVARRARRRSRRPRHEVAPERIIVSIGRHRRRRARRPDPGRARTVAPRSSSTPACPASMPPASRVSAIAERGASCTSSRASRRCWPGPSSGRSTSSSPAPCCSSPPRSWPSSPS